MIHERSRPLSGIGPDSQEHVWGKAVHRVVTEGISPEQAVDEAIARIKQILASAGDAEADRAASEKLPRSP